MRVESEARVQAKAIVDEAKVEVEKVKAGAENEYRQRRAELQRNENRLSQKIDSLDRKLENLDHRDRQLNNREKEIETLRVNVTEIRDKQLKKLEEISQLSSADARKILLENMEAEMKEETARRIREWEVALQQQANEKSQEILSQAIQRSASEIVSETTVSVVPIPNDEMKGRLIGREGRNIRALEQATGVDLIIDDTPETVILSSFDPVRREIARVSLERLIADGRIHPARIEEIVEKVKKEIDAAIKEEGEKAVFDLGLHGIHPELVRLLGKLRYRTSYAQNVLQHSREVAYLAGIMAGELGVDAKLAKRAGLLHDIGKAIDHEVEGSHQMIGANIAKKYNENFKVVNAIQVHHGEGEPATVEAALVAAADALSAARPGARKESLESYLKRLEKLEQLAMSFKGVDRCYAIQAGREIRIIVKPEDISDEISAQISRDLARRIEEGLTYPGQIKVTVIRETRFVEMAK